MPLVRFQAWRSAAASMLVALTLLLPTAAATSAPASATGLPLLDVKKPLHPLLQFGAQVDSTHHVRVLVQKTTPLISSLDIARAVDALVFEDFPLIQAVSLDVPLVLAPVLAALPGVKYVSFDGPVLPLAVDTSHLATTYEAAINVPSVWNGAPGASGAGIGVAVLDTGVNTALPDFPSNVVAVNTNPRASGPQDGYGHGTHVVGKINGRDPQGRYIGVAPDARVISVKISDDSGASSESDLIRGLQWVSANRAAYNIRVANLSVSTALPTSYLASPVAAAAEQLWRQGVVVVTAAGNNGTDHAATWSAPGNDPWLITVGALDHNQTASPADDSLAAFSSRGKTEDGVYKPDIVAPGRQIVAPLAGPSVVLAQQLPDHVMAGGYLRLSGTSMSAPVTSGVVALLLQRYPNLSPDQVKWLLATTARGYPGKTDSAGVVDPLAALVRASAGNVGRANQGLPASGGTILSPIVGLLGGLLGATGLVADSSFWDSAFWDSAYWDAAHWDAAHWDAAHWDAAPD